MKNYKKMIKPPKNGTSQENYKNYDDEVCKEKRKTVGAERSTRLK